MVSFHFRLGLACRVLGADEATWVYGGASGHFFLHVKPQMERVYLSL